MCLVTDVMLIVSFLYHNILIINSITFSIDTVFKAPYSSTSSTPIPSSFSTDVTSLLSGTIISPTPIDPQGK